MKRLALALSLLASACGAPPSYLGIGSGPAPQLQTVDGSQFGSLSIGQISSKVLPGTLVGGIFDDDTEFKIRLNNFYMPPWANPLPCNATEVSWRVATSAGYRVLPNMGCVSQVRLNAAPDSTVPRLSGAIEQASLNGYNRPGFIDAEVLIRWTLQSPGSNSPIMEYESYGGYRVPGPPTSNWTQALTGAVEQSITRLLGQPAFAVVMRDQLRAIPSPARTTEVEDSPPKGSWRYGAIGSSEIITVPQSKLRAATRGNVAEKTIAAVASIEGPTKSGSAFFIASDGLAITNEHVISGQRSLNARLSDGTPARVRVIRSDAEADLALLEIDCAQCATVVPAQREASVGSSVLLVGSPLGLSQSVTRGILSGRRFSRGITFLQTDAAANPGNSGGPLVLESTGAAIGVLTLGLKNSEGVSFAIALEDALRILGVRLPVQSSTRP